MKSLLLALIILFFTQISFAQLYQVQTSETPARKHAISLELLTLRFGTLGINYEYKINSRVSLLAKGGIIGFPLFNGLANDMYLEPGLKWQPYLFRKTKRNEVVMLQDSLYHTGTTHFRGSKTRESGFFFRVGPKWTLGESDNFQGVYVHPSAFVSHFKYDRSEEHWFGDEEVMFPIPGRHFHLTQAKQLGSAGAMFSVGMQWQFWNRLVLDINGGIGYAFQFDSGEVANAFPIEGDPEIDDRSWEKFPVRYSHWSMAEAGETHGLAINLGLSLGIAL